MGEQSVTVLIADDEEEFRTGFVTKHARPRFAVEQITDVYSLPEHLRTASRLPDLVILDLYRTKALPGTKQAKIDNAEVDKLLAKIEADTIELKGVVDRVKIPEGIKVLREIRSIPRLCSLPVLLYTRQGLSLLSDEEIREAIHLGAEWMLKGRSADVERAQMSAFLRDACRKRPRVRRDVALAILGAILGAAIGIGAQALM